MIIIEDLGRLREADAVFLLVFPSLLGHHDAEGAFHIDGVTGPDEYTSIADVMRPVSSPVMPRPALKKRAMPGCAGFATARARSSIRAWCSTSRVPTRSPSTARR